MKFFTLGRSLLLAAIVLLTGCLMPEPLKKEQALFEEFVLNNPDISHHLMEVDGNRLHYAAAGDSKNPALIIMHGTPGSWQQYSRYLTEATLLEHFYMIVVDRPGWGASTLADNRQYASFEDHSMILAGFISALKGDSGNQPVILAGHSLGSSIAPRVAMDHPELVDGLMLFAGSLDPELGDPRWYNRVANLPGFSYLLGKSMTRANKEIYELKANLQRMRPHWEKIRAKALVVQGMKDELVYPANIDFAEAVLKPANSKVVRLYDEGHLFPMTLRDEVMEWALELLDMIRQDA